MAVENKLKYVNLVQVQIQMDKSKTYEPNTYYFDKFNKPRFEIKPELFSEEGNPSTLAINAMEEKLEWIVKGSEKIRENH